MVCYPPPTGDQVSCVWCVLPRSCSSSSLRVLTWWLLVGCKPLLPALVGYSSSSSPLKRTSKIHDHPPHASSHSLLSCLYNCQFLAGMGLTAVAFVSLDLSILSHSCTQKSRTGSCSKALVWAIRCCVFLSVFYSLFFMIAGWSKCPRMLPEERYYWGSSSILRVVVGGRTSRTPACCGWCARFLSPL
jgi:hypothetical protein